MKLCDFCFNGSGAYTPAVTQIAIGNPDAPDEIYDSCISCLNVVKELLNQQKTEEKKSGPGRSRKAA